MDVVLDVIAGLVIWTVLALALAHGLVRIMR